MSDALSAFDTVIGVISLQTRRLVPDIGPYAQEYFPWLAECADGDNLPDRGRRVPYRGRPSDAAADLSALLTNTAMMTRASMVMPSMEIFILLSTSLLTPNPRSLVMRR